MPALNTTLSVHISDTTGPDWGLVFFVKIIAADLAVKGTAAYFKSPGGLMLVPVGFLKNSKN